ncbi:hypothetical protein CT0861_11269 [Colletotrichum tofieldiae]|uniref:Uncharacterized protein n=1 Tax=Colletotrichum tofieldiae TaxID=708197 RepID=A0A166NFP5_9PEZI|nr:hypothetical protein CT0861_11269 [Colletotrichum tofieldiae]
MAPPSHDGDRDESAHHQQGAAPPSSEGGRSTDSAASALRGIKKQLAAKKAEQAARALQQHQQHQHQEHHQPAHAPSDDNPPPPFPDPHRHHQHLQRHQHHPRSSSSPQEPPPKRHGRSDRGAFPAHSRSPPPTSRPQQPALSSFILALLASVLDHVASMCVAAPVRRLARYLASFCFLCLVVLAVLFAGGAMASWTLLVACDELAIIPRAWCRQTPAAGATVHASSATVAVLRPVFFDFGHALAAMAQEQEAFMTDTQRSAFAVAARAEASAQRLEELSRAHARRLETAQTNVMGLVAAVEKHLAKPRDQPSQGGGRRQWLLAMPWPWLSGPSSPVAGFLGEMERILSAELRDRHDLNASLAASSGELRDVSSHLCGWNKALMGELQHKRYHLADTETRIRDHLARERRLWYATWWTQQGGVQEWVDQAHTVRRELTRWRRRKDKANAVCLVARSGVARAVKVARAVREEMARLQELGGDAEALREDVTAAAAGPKHVNRQSWRRWEEKTADLGSLYLRSLRESYRTFA